MKIFITGANGFLGSNLVRKLLASNYEVRAFIHPKMQTTTLDGLNIETALGDLLNKQDVINAMRDCDFVIHAAASTDVWPSRSEKVKAVNIQGTQNILSAIKANNIKKAVYVGTASSFGFGSKEAPGTETSPFASAKYGLDYIDSKYEAQKMVLKQIKEDNLPITITNPTFMLGALDAKPGPGEMILSFYKGKVPGYSAGGRNYIHVEDAALGIIAALENGKTGENYILGNQNLSYKELFEIIAEVTEKKPLKLNIPAAAIKLYGKINSSISSLTGRKPNVSYAMATIACDGQYYSASKAVKELGLPQTPVKKAIEDSFKWFKQNGYL